uniref:Uncharacterized protein n=1 Tax=Glossina palpalis gambiensis TaxID=67801 RepID=A0A1B0C3R0_9MUSC
MDSIVSSQELLVKLNSFLIFNTNSVTETAKLIEEPTALVRKQMLLSLCNLSLLLVCNCYLVIAVWCKIIAPILDDNDPKKTELAMESFHSRVLLIIKGFYQSNRSEHFYALGNNKNDAIYSIMRLIAKLFSPGFASTHVKAG